MSRTSLATPCPVAGITAFRRLSTASTTSSLQQDDTCTAEIEYTRAIQQEYRHARPRRKSTFQPRRKEKDAGITIFEDVVEDEELVVEPAKVSLAGKTLLGKPAQRIKTMANPLGEIGQARQRASIAPQGQEVVEEPAQRANAVRGGLKKEPRRRTIFVPADDTTIMTIHPGANTTDRLNDTFQLFSPPQQPYAAPVSAAIPAIDATEEAPKPVRKARMSLAGPPKRMPLQQMTAATNNLPNIDDLPGQNGGKENLPPGGIAKVFDLKTKEVSKAAIREPTIQPVPKSLSTSVSRLYAPTAASQARQARIARDPVPLPKRQAKSSSPKTGPHDRPPGHGKKPLVAQAKPTTITASVAGRQDGQAPPTTSENERKPIKRSTPPRHCDRSSHRPSKLSQYPVLPEDVAQPQLYQESWLSHQEIALTELINEIFSRAEPSNPAWQTSGKTLREQMLEIYHQPFVTTLHTRLGASLLYGALARPQYMPSPRDLTQDIGLRKCFINLWLQSYDEDALRAAAEVVIGRQVPRKACSLPTAFEATESVMDPSKGKRVLVGFLETFLVTVGDVDASQGSDAEVEGGIEGRRWRKTILRSLMLVWLLDQAKTKDAISGCLFKRSSSLKSSTAVLHNLSSLLVPSIGDITRPLRHFDYEVKHVQDPLDEVVYQIQNLAVDLRDGIYLTRLVEFLLFSPGANAKLKSDSDDCNATMTITLPDATVLESALRAQGDEPPGKVLSQHLKMPCLGRAQKVFNVQIALGALAAYSKDAAIALADVSADDIVNGHREKTLALLWSLVRAHGFTQLVNWAELTADIHGHAPGVQVSGCESQQEREALLLAWAAAYCGKHGIQISNLTTSFADGKAYESILDVFIDLLTTTKSRCGMAKLENSLRLVGCSNAFIRQLTSASQAIPSRTTTIANLAFLASRLLPLARRRNAAAIIQRAWRRRRSRKSISRRIVLTRLAHACAAVVRTQQKLIYAANVLQRSWRAVLAARSAKLNSDVEVFQVMAKGWRVRRHVCKFAASRLDGMHSLRLTSGW